MSKELFVSSTPHETKVAIVEDDQLSEIYYERENEYTLAGSIYKGRVTRVLPGMQSAFVNIGLERDAFLYVSDFLLEEDEDTEGLDQVVARPHIIASPATEEPAEERPAGGEDQEGPIEAVEMMPPAEAGAAEEELAGGPDGGGASAPRQSEGEPEREGTRKWRGRRRRRGGRGRFQDREERGGQTQEQTPQREHAEGQERPAAEETAAAQEPRHERPAQERPSSAHGPVVLPGESISKYQPRENKPAPRAETKPRQVSAARPSTEYTIEPSQFSPGAMVLPGESISKYRGQKTAPRPAAPEPAADVTVRPEEHGFLQDVESAGPVPHIAEHAEGEHRVESARPLGEVVSHEVEAVTQPIQEAKPEGLRHDEERFEHMNLAATFGGEATEPGEETATEELGEEPAETANVDSSVAGPPAPGAAPGVMEEEEIEEEESELPGFEQDADLTDYEELEEEVLGSGSDQMVAAGRELTEAVRDAHINERATGQYEAEGLDAEELDEVAEVLGLGEEGEEEPEEFESAEGEGEDPEGARAEHRASTGTAGYQQPQRSDRRGGDRRGRRPGRRPMRGRRHHAPRRLPAISDLLKEGQEILRSEEHTSEL